MALSSWWMRTLALQGCSRSRPRLTSLEAEGARSRTRSARGGRLSGSDPRSPRCPTNRIMGLEQSSVAPRNKFLNIWPSAGGESITPTSARSRPGRCNRGSKILSVGQFVCPTLRMRNFVSGLRRWKPNWPLQHGSARVAASDPAQPGRVSGGRGNRGGGDHLETSDAHIDGVGWWTEDGID